ncbi:MAG TPA: hypothetical protein VLA48_02855 [Nitrososphaeraceae archaeon]|nr:hypothetical protein [Nitrososphaeraceae archaeon]
MRTIRTKIYKFEELSKEAQGIVIEEYRNGNTDIDLDPFNESCKEQIEEAGFYDDVSLQYSLSYSQGDGLSFSCDKIKESVLFSFFAEILGAGKEKTAKVLIDNCSFTLLASGHYTYASKSHIDYYLEGGFKDLSNCEEIIAQVLDKLENYYLDLCKELENQGYKCIEDINSDDYIKEILSINNYEFLSNGKMY